MPDSENPILFMEELQRVPLRHRRTQVPGTVLVYRSRNGRLRTIPNGYTTAELLLWGPRLAYEIDVARHLIDVPIEVSHPLMLEPVLMTATMSWQVTDPIAVVATRTTNPYRLCESAAVAMLQRVVDEHVPTSSAQLAAALQTAGPMRLDLPEGLHCDVLGVAARFSPRPSDTDDLDAPAVRRAYLELSGRVRHVLDRIPAAAESSLIGPLTQLIEVYADCVADIERSALDLETGGPDEPA